ncbi:MAG: hypothetical protein ACJA2S_002223 [Cyclobacteriaceae bacterium]|jgi:hypothetical protein
METKFELFIDHWHQIALIWSQVTLGVAALIFGYYLLLLTTSRTLPQKYKFLSTHEIKYFWYTALSLTISFSFFLNSIMVREHETSDNFSLIIKIALAGAIGFLVGYVLNTYLKVYYPFILEKKLSNLRFKKRISPNTKKEMRLLNEDEENIHLSDEMIAHENTFAYDYDVWIDEETGYKIIEKYEGNLHTLICDKCRFRTLKEYKEEVKSEPTQNEKGTVVKYYQCSYCDHKEEKTSRVSPLSKHEDYAAA